MAGFFLVLACRSLLASADPANQAQGERLLGATGISACVLWFVGLASAALQRPANPNRLLSFFSTFWVSSPLLGLGLVVGLESDMLRKAAILQILVPIWAGDIAGIFTGMAFGKRLLAPSISPKKTVAGAVGNVIFSVLASIGVATIFSRYDPHFALQPVAAAVLGVLISIVGQAGDLYESWLKRRVNLKDSGSILPGHGGVLDRIDSLLAVVWPVFLFAAILTVFSYR